LNSNLGNPHILKIMVLKSIVEQGESGWLAGQIGELPAALSQGRTIDELILNLSDALKTVLDIDYEPYICG
jgi:predicted RNase H-like HicB family nuclease